MEKIGCKKLLLYPYAHLSSNLAKPSVAMNLLEKMEKEAFRRVSGSMICAIALGFGAAYLGTFVSIALFIVAIMKVWGVQSKRPIIITAIVAPILIYIIFNQVLLVQLPAGILM